MQCHRCRTAMRLTESISEGHVRQTWYQCPACGANQTVSQPDECTLRRIGSSLRCSLGWSQAVCFERRGAQMASPAEGVGIGK